MKCWLGGEGSRWKRGRERKMWRRDGKRTVYGERREQERLMMMGRGLDLC